MQHQSGIDLAARQRFELHVAGRFDQFQRHLRTLEAKFAHPYRQPLETDGRHESQPNAPDFAGCRSPCAYRQRLRPRQHVAYVRQQGFTGSGECNTALRAVEQLHAERFLQLRDGLRHRWLGHVQASRGAAEMQFFGDCNELPPGTQVDERFFHFQRQWLSPPGSQFSHRRPGTRSKCLTLSVTSTAPSASA